MLLKRFKNIVFWNQLRIAVELIKHVQYDKKLWVKSWLIIVSFMHNDHNATEATLRR